MYKFICKESFYFNLTKPYHYFNKGEFYDFKVNYVNNGILYESTDCDYIVSEIGFNRNFLTTEELRDIKINEILNKEKNIKWKK